MLDQHSILAPIQAPPTPNSVSFWLEQLTDVIELYSAQMQLCSDSLKLGNTSEGYAAQTITKHLADDSFWLIQTLKKSQDYLDSLENNNLEKGGENA